MGTINQQYKNCEWYNYGLSTSHIVKMKIRLQLPTVLEGTRPQIKFVNIIWTNVTNSGAIKRSISATLFLARVIQL